MDPYTCQTKRTPTDDSQWAFAPVWGGTLKEEGKISFEGNCFEKIDMQMTYDGQNNEFHVIADLEKPFSKTCAESIFLANTELYHFEVVRFSGRHEWTFDVQSDDAKVDLSQHGLQTYLFCEDIQEELLSIITTLKAFIGGLGLHGKISLFEAHVPEYMEKANKEFMKWGLGWELEERPTRKVHIDESLVQSGDYFAVLRLDGLDPMIMYGTGSHSGHSVMAMRFDDGLYIVESQDSWYWPVHRI